MQGRLPALGKVLLLEAPTVKIPSLAPTKYHCSYHQSESICSALKLKDSVPLKLITKFYNRISCHRFLSLATVIGDSHW
jgi:hypothetical protein